MAPTWREQGCSRPAYSVDVEALVGAAAQTTWRPDLKPNQKSAHIFRAHDNLSVRGSFFNAASALSASDLLPKACAPSTRTGGLERVNFAPLPLL
jgi:hypothetical protein